MVGLQGVAIAERATQQALQYARERKQGRGDGASGAASVPIIEHVDVRRMLLTMRALTQGARAICYTTAIALDRSHLADNANDRKTAADRAALLTPVAKAFSTDIGIDVASLGIQVHGGMGFIEETGAAQHYRDARIAAIYEGTNGIQAIDLVTRKLPLNGGETIKTFIATLREIVHHVRATNHHAFGATANCLGDAVDSLENATAWLMANVRNDTTAALAGATPYLRLFANAAGGCMLAKEALAAIKLSDDAASIDRVAMARFFAENIAVQNRGLEAIVVEADASVTTAPLPGDVV